MLVLSFVASYLRDDFGLDQVQIGNLFGWGIFGAMVGGFAFGWIGDRIGRRPAILVSVAGFGLTAIGMGLAPDYASLTVLRFLNGIMLGGLLPLIWTLNIEFAPRAYRATVVTVVMMGYTLGGALAGPITDWIAPHYGWHTVFIASGILTLFLCFILFLSLPESARYLTLKGKAKDKVVAALQKIAPHLEARTSDTIYCSDETGPAGDQERFRISALFSGKLAAITPLLWLAYIGSSMAVYFKATWGPTIFEDVGLTRTEIAYLSSASSIVGSAAGLGLMRFTDRYGPIAIAGLPLLAAPILWIMGTYDTTLTIFVALSLASMTMIGGMHFGLHSIAGVFYPSQFRANGAGWATSIAKIGSISAPVIAGYMLAGGLPVKQAFAIVAVAPLVSGISLLLLSRIAHWGQENETDLVETEEQSALQAAAQ
ncbi:MFS transporter [Altererythrobacter endophyticus]|uniref:MFS transporter n=2 Tax=Altericroceibacterium endophyticum TaxID=1808508 RepID=A0A6I4T5J6_9SPHN|nr:MFS transporter [Altericroceibacterium endophyticum]